MAKYKFTFNVVVETEKKMNAEAEISFEEQENLINCMVDYEKETETICIDEIRSDFNEELFDTLLSLIPDEIKQNCVSMAFTDIKATLIN